MEVQVSKPFTLSGRYFSKKDILQIQETVNLFPCLSRRELALTICENLSWVTPKGSAKIQSCLTALEKLENKGLITLPRKQIKKKREIKTFSFSEEILNGHGFACPSRTKNKKMFRDISLERGGKIRFHISGNVYFEVFFC